MSYDHPTELTKDVTSNYDQAVHLALDSAHTGQAHQSLTAEGRESTAQSYLPAVQIEDHGQGRPEGIGTGALARVSGALHDLVGSAENAASDLGDGIRASKDNVVDYVKEHPVDAMGYAAGALVGATVAVVCAPVELTAAAAVGVGLAGAAAVDGGAYLLRKALE